MQSSPILRARTSYFISICITLVAFVSLRAGRQYAGTVASRDASSRFAPALPAPDKGIITPAGNTIAVNSTVDVANSTDGLCTLREAITAANTNTGSGAVAGECAAGATNGSSDSINFTVAGTINLTGALPAILSDMSINGPGSGSLTVRRDTGGNYRIFSINSGNINISGITITNGRTPDAILNNFTNVGPSGGGILQTSGSLTLTDVVLTGNTTGKGYDDLSSGGSIGGFGGFGGGIDAAGTLTMVNCVVSNNTTGNGGQGGSGGSGGRGAGIFTEANAQVTLQNVMVTGNVTGAGGGPTNGLSGDAAGIWSGGSGFQATASLNMTNVTISNNSTPDANDTTGSGAGLYVIAGTATLNNCTIANNHTGSSSRMFRGAGRGAGIFNDGRMTIRGSTISGNSTGNGDPSGDSNIGGGIDNAFILTMIDSTVSGNSTGTGRSYGGGIYSGNLLNLINCTITGNTDGSTHVHGIAASNQVNVRNTIIARNGPGGTGPDIDNTFVAPTVTSQGHNLIGNPGSITSFTRPGDQVGVDPLLGPLVNNGGPTKTHALLSTSPALDAGDNCVTDAAHCGDSNISQILTDQRGFNRIVDGPDADAISTVDIGAYETQVALANLPDTSSNEDTQLLVPFDGGDTSTITSVTATSSNPTLVPNDSVHLNVAITGSTGIVTINPAANLSGTTNITLTINRTGGSESKMFVLTINPVNDAPSFTKGADQTINEDAGAQTFNNWATNISAGPPDESGQTLTFQVTANTNAGLFSSAPAISSTGTLTYTPAANANGSATITVSLMDNGGTANGGVDTSAAQTFAVTVNAVNDAPSFTKGPDRTVNEDSGFQFISNWATNISAGPPDESGQTLNFVVTNNTNPSLFSGTPFISSSGALSFTPATNANGSATITILLKDSGGTANGGVDTSAPQTFTITVNPVNDAPSFTKGLNQTVNNNAGMQSINNWATNISPGPPDESGQTLTFLVTANSNPGLFSVAPAISSTGTLSYQPVSNAGGTATITIVLQDSGGTANGGVDKSASQSFNITINPIGGFLSFSSANSNTTESSGFITITVKRTGDLSRAATVDYATSGDNGLPCSTANGVATPKCDFTAALGTLGFAAGEGTKTFTVLISQDSYVEGPESLTVSLSNQTGGSALSSPSTATVTISDDVTEPPTNAIDEANNFVRQHYHDFLNREPDASGLAFWSNQITSCGADAACIEVKRINVSAAFFLSIEFQQTGYLVERLYKTAYGDANGASTVGGAHQLAVPVVRFNEFLPDTQQIGQGVVIGQTGWETVLENNKQTFAAQFAQRSRFASAFATSLTPAQFVDALFANAGVIPAATDRNAAVAEFGSATNTSDLAARARALRRVAENSTLMTNEFNRAFVLMQFFGYLRRDPNSGPDTDYSGYDFWLTKLNQFNGNFVSAEMVKAFITSTEYRQRFGL